MGGDTGHEDLNTWCTAEEMTGPIVSPTNISKQLPRRRYGAHCPWIGKNYYCPPSATKNYLKDDNLRGIPKAAADGKCKLYVNMGEYPFPNKSRVLFWGNSHLREVIHALSCQ